MAKRSKEARARMSAAAKKTWEKKRTVAALVKSKIIAGLEEAKAYSDVFAKDIDALSGTGVRTTDKIAESTTAQVEQLKHVWVAAKAIRTTRTTGLIDRMTQAIDKMETQIERLESL